MTVIVVTEHDREYYLRHANLMVNDALEQYECIYIVNGKSCAKCFSCACLEVLIRRHIQGEK